MKVQFIAEISSNHNRDRKRCERFIETAADIGCDAVKFQLFKIKELFAKEALEAKEELRLREEWELPVSFLPFLSEKCRSLGLEFSCTPFYLEAVKQVTGYADFLKIASYELLWLELIELCGRSGLPVILSTGMATIEEIEAAVNALKSAKAEETALLHCVSSYPAKKTSCNLSAIKMLRDKFNCRAGWSDHTVSDDIIYTAVYKWGAEIVEFHLDLDTKGREFGIGHCWLPGKIEAVISNIRKGRCRDRVDASFDGNGLKIPADSETEERNWRADPSDGLRPMMKTRELLGKV